MQLEITLTAPNDADYAASDLGFLLHKHPDHLHRRETSAGQITIFYSEESQDRTTAVLHLEVDPVGLVRGKNQHSDGLLAQYVNDRPFVASSFLSVAMGRAFAQSMAGKSKDRQALADRALPFEIRVVPVALSGDLNLVKRLFEPLGYTVVAPSDVGEEQVVDLCLSVTLRLSDILKHRRSLMNMALARLEEAAPLDEEQEDAPKLKPEEQLEKPLRLHTLRLDTVAEVLRQNNVTSVLDLGCGEGKP